MPRICTVCGRSQYRKKVWEKRQTSSGKIRVICMTCGRDEGWTFNQAAMLVRSVRQVQREQP